MVGCEVAGFVGFSCGDTGFISFGSGIWASVVFKGGDIVIRFAISRNTGLSEASIASCCKSRWFHIYFDSPFFNSKRNATKNSK